MFTCAEERICLVALAEKSSGLEWVEPTTAGHAAFAKLFLMGQHGDKNYDHRRQWIVERLDVLCSAFAIEVLFFAVLSNHFHVVLRTLPRRVKRMGAWEVARRWLTICPGRRVLEDPPPEPSEQQIQALAENKDKIAQIRQRLSDPSWFHRTLKEYISRRANLQENRTGAFWEGRFKCREVMDQESLLVVGLYNDLNLLRAGQGELPWESPYCSAGLRFGAAQGDRSQAAWLANLTLAEGQSDEEPSRTGRRATDKGCLDMSLEEYQRVLAWAATLPKAGQAAMPQELAEALERQRVKPARVHELLQELPNIFRRVIGAASSMAQRAAAVGRRWFQGVGQAAHYFG